MKVINFIFEISFLSKYVLIDEPILIKRPQIVVDTIPTNIPTSPKKDLVNLENKLQRLEQLQYALTKQVIYFISINKLVFFFFLHRN